MTPDEIRQAFDNIRVWQRGDRRVPHKPLRKQLFVMVRDLWVARALDQEPRFTSHEFVFKKPGRNAN